MDNFQVYQKFHNLPLYKNFWPENHMYQDDLMLHLVFRLHFQPYTKRSRKKELIPEIIFSLCFVT